MIRLLSPLSRRYAHALSLAVPQEEWERIRQELKELSRVVSESGVLSILETARLSQQRRRELLMELAEGLGLSSVVQRFFLLLDRKRRLLLLPQIADAFSQMIEEKEGVVEAEGECTREFLPEERKVIERFFEREAKKRLKITWRLNPELKAGFRVRVGSRIWEGSIRHDLDRWQKLLEKRIAL
jgi:F-type H+-transporting ATPase subunit delta